MTKIVFGIMSAFQRPETVAQLVSSLGGRPVVVHHDFNQRPKFSLPDPSVRFVPDPALTGWGTWGYCEAIVRTLEFCMEQVDFDYFQLLSPTCLPLRPIDEFEAFLDQERPDGNVDMIDLASEADVLLTFGWRFLAPRGSLRLAALRRARSWYFEHDARSRHRSGLAVLVRESPPGLDEPLALLARGFTRSAINGWLGSTPFSGTFRPYVGSCWFGANRALCQHIINAARDPRLVDCFNALPNADESFFPTIIGNSGYRVGPSNHLVNFFNATGNPHWFRPGDLDRIRSSTAFFGRKFPDDPQSPIRLEILERQQGSGASANIVPIGARARRKARIVFGILSSQADPASIAQLVDILAPHTVVINQDFSQQPDFRLSRPNLHYVSDPVHMVPGTWGWPAGVVQLLRHCLNSEPFDYFQLLSPHCLPVKPIAEFEEHVGRCDVDAHADLFELADADAMMSFGYRLYAAPGTRRRAWLERARRWYFQQDAVISEHGGLPVLARRDLPRNMRRELSGRVGLTMTRLARWSLLAPGLPDPTTKRFVGGPWFGASREVCEHLTTRLANPEWLAYFHTLDDPGDSVFATLLGNSGFRIGKSNHVHSPFAGRRQTWLRDGDMSPLLSGPGYFARRFSDDPDAPARRQVLAAISPWVTAVEIPA